MVRTKQRELEEQHEKGKTITRSDEMRDLRDAMQQKMDDVQTLVKQIKDRLEALDKANAVALKKKVIPGSSYPPDDRSPLYPAADNIPCAHVAPVDLLVVHSSMLSIQCRPR